MLGAPGAHPLVLAAIHPPQALTPYRVPDTPRHQLAGPVGGPVVGHHDVKVGAGLAFEIGEQQLQVVTAVVDGHDSADHTLS